jgi:hypothetical protein
MAAETSADAYLPVSIVLFKLHLEFLWENLRSIFSSSSPTATPTPTPTTNQEHSTIDLDSSWDLYLMAALLGLIGALYTMRRQRIALQQQPPVQAPVQ